MRRVDKHKEEVEDFFKGVGCLFGKVGVNYNRTRKDRENKRRGNPMLKRTKNDYEKERNDRKKTYSRVFCGR